jgi:hypothetical protein
MRRLLLLVLAVGLLTPLTAQAAPPEMTPYVEGPDRAPASAPDAKVTVLDKALFSFGLKPPTLDRTVTARLPRAKDGGWDRVILTFTDTPTDDEPWDRVFSVAVGKVELLRGTTPRADMTITKDVTEYAAVLTGTQKFTTSVGTYVGGHRVSVSLAFYDGEQQIHAPRAGVVGAFAGTGIEPEHKDVARRTARATVRFPARAPTGATIELTTSGHLQGGEFWYLPDRGSTTPPVFHLKLDGVEVATAHALPYTYALAGFQGANATEHPLMWWTAQKELDALGVHTGTGEIPPYRATLPADVVGRLTGSHTVEVAVDGKGLWISSVSVLLD